MLMMTTMMMMMVMLVMMVKMVMMVIMVMLVIMIMMIIGPKWPIIWLPWLLVRYENETSTKSTSNVLSKKISFFYVDMADQTKKEDKESVKDKREGGVYTAWPILLTSLVILSKRLIFNTKYFSSFGWIGLKLSFPALSSSMTSNIEKLTNWWHIVLYLETMCFQ